MKLRNLFLASVACAGLFTACSNEMDEVIDNGGNETNNTGEAYASFSYTLPNGGGTNTRADQASAGTEIGTDAENKVNEIAFVLFNEPTGTLNKIVTLSRDKFGPAGAGSSTTYTTATPIKVTTGKQSVYVVVNPSAAVKSFNKTKVDFLGNTETDYKSGDGFMMTNSALVEDYTIEPVLTNTQSNPVKLIVPVQRMAARIDYTAKKADNTYDVVSAQGHKVQITDYRIVNKRTNEFLLKRVGTTAANAVVGAPEAADSYVIDPIFARKSDANFFTSADYTNGYTSKLADASPAYTALNGTLNATTPLDYCLKNTMELNAQKNGATTGLVLKAKYTPTGLTNLAASGDFYRYNGSLYASLRAMYDALNPKFATSSNKADITVDVLGFKDSSETNFAIFAATFTTYESLSAKFVDYYKGGICYYSTFLRHINNNDANKMGIMEFAIVRNNIYKLSINTINQLGEPVAPVDPETPVESADTYLNVTVNVLNWTTRDNSVDL